jgi:uncharacterized protein
MASAQALEIRELASIDAIAANKWNALAGTECPFLRHEFLAALEHTGCVGGRTGWAPAHLALYDNKQLVGAAPVYRKQHSWGEFVFDFGWAQAFERYGQPYYPKLLCAVPFSPVNGARLLCARDRPRAVVQTQLINALAQRCAEQDLSSAHALFVADDERAAFEAQGWLLRSAVQFHWHNAGYRDFDEYLAGFRADKRKQLRRERRRCTEASIHFETVHGSALTPTQIKFIHAVHERTFHLHGHEPYLNVAFFTRIAQTMGDALMVKLAMHAGDPVAAAVFLVSPDTLYGRYWGANDNFHSLHFEACYHQGVEYCIERGLQRFEPGTQGEHKLARGFAPTHTWSAHYIADERFRDAIADFLRRESPAVSAYAAEMAAHTPFRRG